MIHLTPVQWALTIKVVITIGMGALVFSLRLWLTWMKRMQSTSFSGEWLFKMVQFGLVGVFVEVVRRQSLWRIQLPELPPFSVLLLDDLLNLGLLLGYLFFAMAQSYQLAREFRLFRSSFGAYLIQSSFYWIILCDALLFLRLDTEYLPRLKQAFSDSLSPLGWEAVSSVWFLAGLGLALKVRALGMRDADPGLAVLVHETAAAFGIRVRRIKIWRLEGIRNAFATGFLKRGIFFTETLVRDITLQDLKMITGHECAHFKRYHLEIRVLTAGAFLVLGSFLMDFFPDGHWSWLLGYGLLAGTLFLALIRNQEFQADRLAAANLGGGSPMVNALLRTFGGQAVPSDWRRIFVFLSTHPPVQTRIQRLRNLE